MDNSLDQTAQPAAGAQPDAIVCTLGLVELADRGLEWADLNALALTSSLIEGGVASTFPIAIADAVEDLASRENGCCGSWLTTATDRLDDVIRLEITTENPEGLGVIMAMTGHAT